MVLLVDEGRRWQRQRLVSYRDMIDAVLLWDQCVLMSESPPYLLQVHFYSLCQRDDIIIYKHSRKWVNEL